MKFSGDRSSILGTKLIITPSGKLRAKNYKNAPKITAGNCAKNPKITFFSYISVFILLKFLRVVNWGHGPSPLTTPLCRAHAVLIFDPSQCFYRAMHFSAKRGLAIALCRPSVTLVDCDHIGWKSGKLIARTICPIYSVFVAKRRSAYSQGTWGNFGE